MKLQRFEVPGLAHYSYVVGSGGSAVVIDPERNVDVYLEYAAANSFKITHVLETHIHADYASGAGELAERTGAESLLSGHDENEIFQYRFKHRNFVDGQKLDVGDVRIEALYTPGHTPEHLSFLLFDMKRGPVPMAMFSGDFVFVGSLGRPDLLGEAAKQRLAGELYESVNHRISRLPDGLELYPAHGAGSMCGSGMSERPQSTLGYERACNTYFGERDKAEFVEHILATSPPFPDYYRRMKKVNSEGPRSLAELPGQQGLDAHEFRAQMKDATVIDLRSPEAFGASHVPGSLNIGLAPGLATWAAWVVPYERPILLVSDDPTAYREAARWLVRVGLDDIRGHLKNGMAAWTLAGMEQAAIPQIKVAALAERLARDGKTFVLDVRGKGEWEAGHIAGATNIMGGDLEKRLDELPKNRPVHTLCAGGYRSSVAASLLRRHGFREVVNVVGGMGAWGREGLPITRD